MMRYSNPAMIGASIVPIILLGVWLGAMLLYRVADPLAWGLLIFTLIFVLIMTSIGAEISRAIRSRRP